MPEDTSKIVPVTVLAKYLVLTSLPDTKDIWRYLE